MLTGSARKVGETWPPKVAHAQTATNRMKKVSPRPTRGPGATGSSGRIGLSWRRGALFDEAGVDDLARVRHRLDDAEAEQEVGCLLGEGLDVAGEELLVRGLVRPAKVGG